MVKIEQILTTRVANYLKRHYPAQPFRFDVGADIRTDMKSAKRSKELHGRWSRGYPDLFIPHLKHHKKRKKTYAGLYLELKATKTVPNTEHTRRQAAYHSILQSLGYKCEFCCGFEECIGLIKEYLN